MKIVTPPPDVFPGLTVDTAVYSLQKTKKPGDSNEFLFHQTILPNGLGCGYLVWAARPVVRIEATAAVFLRGSLVARRAAVRL